VRYTLKTPYRDGTSHVGFEPLDFIARLAALVPEPRVHLTRYHGVFAPHSRWRAAITPAGRGSGIQPADTRTPAERHRALSWAQRFKRVFKLDLQSCEGWRRSGAGDRLHRGPAGHWEDSGAPRDARAEAGGRGAGGTRCSGDRVAPGMAAGNGCRAWALFDLYSLLKQAHFWPKVPE
jgi:hypothetical protein